MTKLIVPFRDFANAPGKGQKSRGAERERETLLRRDEKITEDVGLHDFKASVDQNVIRVVTPSTFACRHRHSSRAPLFPTIVRAVNSQKSIISLTTCLTCRPVATVHPADARRS
jgi:hypothetical protein